MGLYNAILAACLAWLLLATGLDDGHARSLAALLLLSIVIAGAFGGFTIKWTIPIFQSLPALISSAGPAYDVEVNPPGSKKQGGAIVIHLSRIARRSKGWEFGRICVTYAHVAVYLE